MGHLSTIGPSNTGGFGRFATLDEDRQRLSFEQLYHIPRGYLLKPLKWASAAFSGILLRLRI
jgi:hypothetical protein